jgi:hypothetical protein
MYRIQWFYWPWWDSPGKGGGLQGHGEEAVVAVVEVRENARVAGATREHTFSRRTRRAREEARGVGGDAGRGQRRRGHGGWEAQGRAWGVGSAREGTGCGKRRRGRGAREEAREA